MASNGKNSVTKAQAETHRRVLQLLLKHDDNRRCADCLARGPTWASVNLGVFVCLNCSGVHRSLGTDCSKVRSTTLDTWLPEQVAFVQRMGNRRANLFWEGRLPRNFKRPAEGDMSSLSTFINDKYRERAYALRTWDKAPTIETYLVHPFMQQSEDGRVTEHGIAEVEEPSATRRPGQSNPGGSNRRWSGHGAVIDAGNLRPPEPAQRQSATARRTAPQGLPPPSAKQPAPPPELFDLLSLNEPESAPSLSVVEMLMPGRNPGSSPAPASHRVVLSQESLPDAPSDGGWAAFVSSPAGTAAAANPAEDHWDAFQTGTGSATAADPFGASEVAATPAVEQATFQPKFPSAPSSPAAQHDTGNKKTHHRAQKSAEEIMRMFDKPQQQASQDNLFSANFPPVGGFPAPPAGMENFPIPPAGMEGLNLPAHLWMPFQMPSGAPTHADLTFPPQMFDLANGMPTAVPGSGGGGMHGGWASMPAMPGSSLGSSPNPSKNML